MAEFVRARAKRNNAFFCIVTLREKRPEKPIEWKLSDTMSENESAGFSVMASGPGPSVRFRGWARSASREILMRVSAAHSWGGL